MKKILLSLLLLVPFMAFASDHNLTRIDRESMQVSHDIGRMSLYHNGTAFIAKQNGIKTEIGSESLDGALRNVNSTNLGAFLKAGRIQVNRTHDGSLMLRHHVDGKGGGPVLAGFSYWCVKTLCWAGIMGAGGVVAATGVGAAVLAAGGGGAALTAGTLATGGAKIAMGTIAGTSIATGASAGITASTVAALSSVPIVGTVVTTVSTATGAGLVGAAMIATPTGAAIATVGTAAAAPAMAGTALGIAGGIEALAMAAYIAAMAAPTP